jgi:ribonuclease BN (tRNA processing enzyme)
VFGGDRSTHDEFVAAIESCDLLIHNATYDDSMAEKAQEAWHRTIGQALEFWLANSKSAALLF